MPVFQVGPPTPARGGQPGFIDPMEAIKDQEKIEQFANLEKITNAFIQKDLKKKEAQRKADNRIAESFLDESYKQLKATGNENVFNEVVQGRTWVPEGLSEEDETRIRKFYSSLSDAGLSFFEASEALKADKIFQNSRDTAIKSKATEGFKQGMSREEVLESIQELVKTSPLESMKRLDVTPEQFASSDRVQSLVDVAQLDTQMAESALRRAETSQVAQVRFEDSPIYQSVSHKNTESIEEFKSRLFDKNLELTDLAKSFLPKNASEEQKASFKTYLREEYSKLNRRNHQYLKEVEENAEAVEVSDYYLSTSKSIEGVFYSPLGESYDKKAAEALKDIEKAEKELQKIAKESQYPEVRNRAKRTLKNLGEEKVRLQEDRQVKEKARASKVKREAIVSLAKIGLTDSRKLKIVTLGLGDNPTPDQLLKAGIKLVQSLGTVDNQGKGQSKFTHDFSDFDGGDLGTDFKPQDASDLLTKAQTAILSYIKSEEDLESNRKDSAFRGPEERAYRTEQAQERFAKGIEFIKGFGQDAIDRWETLQGKDWDSDTTEEFRGKVASDYAMVLRQEFIEAAKKGFVSEEDIATVNDELITIDPNASRIKLTEEEINDIRSVTEKVKTDAFVGRAKSFVEDISTVTEEDLQGLEDGFLNIIPSLSDSQVSKAREEYKEAKKQFELKQQFIESPVKAFQHEHEPAAKAVINSQYKDFSITDLQDPGSIFSRINESSEAGGYPQYRSGFLGDMMDVVLGGGDDGAIAKDMLIEMHSNVRTNSRLKNLIAEVIPELKEVGNKSKTNLALALHDLMGSEEFQAIVKEGDKDFLSESDYAAIREKGFVGGRQDTSEQLLASVMADLAGRKNDGWKAEDRDRASINLMSIRHLAATNPEKYKIEAFRMVNGGPKASFGMTFKQYHQKWNADQSALKKRFTVKGMVFDDVPGHVSIVGQRVFEGNNGQARVVFDYKYDLDGEIQTTNFIQIIEEASGDRDQSKYDRLLREHGTHSESNISNTVVPRPEASPPETPKAIATSASDLPLFVAGEEPYMNESEYTQFESANADSLGKVGIHPGLLMAFSEDARPSSKVAENFVDHGVFDTFYSPRDTHGYVSTARKSNGFYKSENNHLEYFKQGLHKDPMFVAIYGGEWRTESDNNNKITMAEGFTEELGGFAGGFAGAAMAVPSAKAGAAGGAKLGAFGGPVGAVVGGTLGALAGGMMGYFGGGWAARAMRGMDEGEIAEAVDAYGNSATPMEIRVLFYSLREVDDALRSDPENKQYQEWKSLIVDDLSRINPATIPNFESFDY